MVLERIPWDASTEVVDSELGTIGRSFVTSAVEERMLGSGLGYVACGSAGEATAAEEEEEVVAVEVGVEVKEIDCVSDCADRCAAMFVVVGVRGEVVVEPRPATPAVVSRSTDCVVFLNDLESDFELTDILECTLVYGIVERLWEAWLLGRCEHFAKTSGDVREAERGCQWFRDADCDA